MASVQGLAHLIVVKRHVVCEHFGEEEAQADNYEQRRVQHRQRDERGRPEGKGAW